MRFKKIKKKKKIWGGAYCYYLNILHLGVILLWSEKYFGMVTLLLCKAVLGKEALPLGAAYYFKVQNTGLDHNMLLWITLQCFGAAKPWNSTEENDFIDTNICTEVLQNDFILS